MAIHGEAPTATHAEFTETMHYAASKYMNFWFTALPVCISINLLLRLKTDYHRHSSQTQRILWCTVSLEFMTSGNRDLDHRPSDQIGTRQTNGTLVDCVTPPLIMRAA